MNKHELFKVFLKEDDIEEWMNSGTVRPISLSFGLDLGLVVIGYVEETPTHGYTIEIDELGLPIVGATKEAIESYINKQAAVVDGDIICTSVICSVGDVSPVFLVQHQKR